eukprot:TRINITY_DN14076_c0_g1_i1.p1 TRINITY_DN14076_c0_g1~~TRINITY_DN14076_c0_g1_i1.p1  ORF type:complete len:149 (-),score=30.93 TRINITY_DN14076_c0_g1_i1:26-472(-)
MQPASRFLIFFTFYATSLASASASVHCGQCERVIILATGPAATEHPDSLGLYNVDGSFWENMIPFFKSRSPQVLEKFLTVHPYANPDMDYVPWIISDHFSSLDLSHATIRTQDRGGILCPWEPQGLVWEYKTKNGDWEVDSSIKVVCN